MNEPAILWFRQDLRISNNPALAAALADHQHVIPVYIHADDGPDDWPHGAASRWWLHYSLKSLDKSLRELGSRLVIRTGGDSHRIVQSLLEQTGARYIYWNRLYEPSHIKRDKTIKQALRDQGIEVKSFNSALLYEPWEITNNHGGPFRVFTPFWKACIKSGLQVDQYESPQQLPRVSNSINSVKLETLELLPKSRWDKAFANYWCIGETGADQCLDEFLEQAVLNYQDDRNRPDINGTSRLSAHLHFGEISPQQIIDKTSQFANFSRQQGMITSTDCFIRELGWREFAYHLLYHYPHTVENPLYDRFEHFPWEKNYTRNLRAWQQGLSGIPIVDAGMRQLWHTGWMHNRIRMIVASLLTKNMLIPWQEGAKWFWDTLVDADLANNTLGWQWTAGCGADAAPFFRIFNPVTQGEKFDPRGLYVRQWVPEIASLPDKYLHQPWSAPVSILDEHAIKLGKDYPRAVVDLKATRERALERYKVIKKPST